MSATATATATRAARAARADFDGDREIVSREDQARRLAREFKTSRKYPIESSELEAEALLALTEAARDYPTADTVLPFGAFASQRIQWRLDDFVQAWYRLARHDYNTGRKEGRRIVSLSVVEGMDGKPVNLRAKEPASDPATGLYIEDCRRLVDTVLSDREKQVLDMRYQDHMSLKEIAEALGLKHIRARQIHSEALASLRAAMDERDEADEAGDEADDDENAESAEAE